MAGSTVNLDRFLVYKMSLDGSVPTRLAQGPRDVEARRTADGTLLFYLDAQDFGAFVLMRQPLRGGPVQKVSASRDGECTSIQRSSLKICVCGVQLMQSGG